MTQELSPRERRHERTRQAILDAARKIVSQQGAEALSLRAVAQAIDYSPAGIYEYFASKEEMVMALCMQGHRRLKEYLLRADPTLPVEEHLEEIGLAYIDFALRNPDFYQLMFTTQLPPDASAAMKEAMLTDNSSFPLLVNAVQRGIDEGIFHARPGFEALEMALMAWAMVHGMAMLRTHQLKQLPVDFAAVERESLHRLSNALKGH